MIELGKLTPFGRKQWTKRQFDEWERADLYKSIEESKRIYAKPTDKKQLDKIDKSKWKTTVDKKVNYLLARKPTVKGGSQEDLDNLLDFVKESARELLIRGSLIWTVQGDGISIDPVPMIMNNTIAVYQDESKETPVAFIRKYTDIELDEQTGAENEVVYYECYYDDKRDTYCFSDESRDNIGQTFDEPPYFIELGKTGTAPLYSYVDRILIAFDNILKHQDTTTAANTAPITEIRGYTGTPDEDLEQVVNITKIIKTEGTGGVTVHQRSMDSAAIDTWTKRLLEEYYEATCTVGKDNELAYAQSGKAMDRLFVDMDNDAKALAHILEQALVDYFEYIGKGKVDIIWNTDRPVDEATVIASVATSQGTLSTETLLEHHPWVSDVQEELARLGRDGTAGIEDLIDNEGE